MVGQIPLGMGVHEIEAQKKRGMKLILGVYNSLLSKVGNNLNVW